MQDQLQIRFVCKNLVQFQRAGPYCLIGFSCQGGGLHLRYAQNIHATIHHINAFQARILLKNPNRKLRKGSRDSTKPFSTQSLTT